jgi:glycosyltransferase involved in cell wall biosynthesis
MEIIIVDDASRPEHRTKLHRFSTVARIIPLDENVGPAQARNIGTECARGDAVAFLDDDDEWTPDKLEQQWPLMARNDRIAAVTSAIAVVDSNTETLLDTYHQRSNNTISLATALEGTPAMIQTMLIRRQVMTELGGFDRRFRQMEDQEFFIRLALTDAVIIHCSNVLARLHRRSGDHLTDRKMSFLRNQIRIVNKYNSLYEAVFGPHGAQVAKSNCIRRAGIRQGGIAGRLLYSCGCLAGAAYGPLWNLLATGKMTDVPYSALHA